MDFLETCREAWRLYREAKIAKKHWEECKRECALVNAKLIKLMETEGVSKQQIAGFGTISVSANAYAKVPKTPEGWALVYDYITENYGAETLRGMMSINAKKLTAFYANEKKLQNEAGDFRWELPGIPDSGVDTRLSFRGESK